MIIEADKAESEGGMIIKGKKELVRFAVGSIRKWELAEIANRTNIGDKVRYKASRDKVGETEHKVGKGHWEISTLCAGKGRSLPRGDPLGGHGAHIPDRGTCKRRIVKKKGGAIPW